MAYCKALRDLGSTVEFILHPAYSRCAELTNLAPASFSIDPCVIAKKAFTHALFWNVALGNHALASQLKDAGAKVSYVYHEPWESLRRYARTEGIRNIAKLTLAHHLSINMLKVADVVILPSRRAMDTYKQADIEYNQNAIYIPLLFDDESNGLLLCEKRHFSFIGGISKPHGFDQFIAFMRYALKNRLDLQFLIASKNKFPQAVLSEDVFQRNRERIAIHCGRPLTNREINECYARSFCVWNLYRRSTQSGVLPNAFMLGTPVIASRTGAFLEYIHDSYNGRFAAADDHFGTMTALENIKSNTANYRENCRQTFLETFYYRTNLDKVSTALSLAEG